ncbi:leucine-rich repeat-containing protein 24 [Latimeria chalumnae]|uniref:leucine-rich repeat-containing protein 24 n=1 Tax=Latimeria chalumnae TaxID=7897 RepID=UPI0003C10F2A|nr:PREDICTED: leucine-rich repeat-containing protein 24 [Latimeria chalumnae]|eukprot:XP_005999370.1 PREDICTED: leucine-rich repeat-containing protein 24 [Latimeria chalumnae]
MDLIPVLLIVSFHMLRTHSCPTGCRCYSMTVECGSTGLKEVPSGIPHSMQTLFLQDNSIFQIRREDLSELPRLQYLYIQNNSISAIEPGSFQNQTSLVELALNGNRIHLVSSSIFKGMEHLRVLYLAGNQITKIADFTFAGLQRLQELHLQENSIETLEDQALAGLSSLALLDLSRNNLRTISQAALRPLISLQVLRLTENPWRCDCALHWLRTWITEQGQRLLTSSNKRIVCSEPPRLSHQSLLGVSGNSLICIPPVVQVQPMEVMARLGDDLRVSCQASGYPQPQVSWKKLARVRAEMSKVDPRPADSSVGGGTFQLLERNKGEPFDRDTGSGMLFLSNITAAHAGKYECEASNAGGTAKVAFHLMVNLSNQLSRSYPSVDISQEPLYDMESMEFSALSMATQTAIAIGISLLALIALLLVVVIYRKHRKRKKEKKEENILYVNDYSDGPTTFAQLEEYRDERGHEMFVIDRNKTVFPTYKDSEGMGSLMGLPQLDQLQDQATQTVEEEAGPDEEAGREEGEEEEMFVNQGIMFQHHIAYEIHC